MVWQISDKRVKYYMENIIKYDERAAGGIVYKTIDEEVVWLVIKVLRKKDKGPIKARRGETKRFVYKLPKGHLREGEFLKQAALREVAEEGKVSAEIVIKIGSNNYIYKDRLEGGKIIKRVTFFLMKFMGLDTNEYSDAEKIIAREWLSIERAVKKLSYESEKKLLQRASQILNKME